MPNPPFTGADYIEWGGEKTSLDFTFSCENLFFVVVVVVVVLILMGKFRANQMMVSCCGQEMDEENE